MVSPVYGLNLLWSAEDHRKWQVFTNLTLMWRRIQSGKQLWTWKFLWSEAHVNRVNQMSPNSRGRDSVSVQLWRQLPGCYQAWLRGRIHSLLHTVAQAHLSCSWWSGHSSEWTNLGLSLFAALLLIARCRRYGLNSVFPERPEIREAPYWSKEPGSGILALICDFIMAWSNALN